MQMARPTSKIPATLKKLRCWPDLPLTSEPHCLIKKLHPTDLIASLNFAHIARDLEVRSFKNLGAKPPTNSSGSLRTPIACALTSVPHDQLLSLDIARQHRHDAGMFSYRWLSHELDANDSTYRATSPSAPSRSSRKRRSRTALSLNGSVLEPATPSGTKHSPLVSTLFQASDRFGRT